MHNNKKEKSLGQESQDKINKKKTKYVVQLEQLYLSPSILQNKHFINFL